MDTEHLPLYYESALFDKDGVRRHKVGWEIPQSAMDEEGNQLAPVFVFLEEPMDPPLFICIVQLPDTKPIFLKNNAARTSKEEARTAVSEALAKALCSQGSRDPGVLPDDLEYWGLTYQ